MLSLGMKKIPWVIKAKVASVFIVKGFCNPGVIVNTDTSSSHGHESLI